MALVAAAEGLISAGRQPAVGEAAEAAGISRATAYRYFPTQEMLWAKVALFSAGGPLFVPVAKNMSVPDAAAELVRRVGDWTCANEQPLRTLLRLSLDPSTGVRRPGHRVGWISDVLAPARDQMDPEVYDRLSGALALVLGIDPIVVMKDIANATRDEALDALEWAARALVEAALNSRSSSRQDGAIRGLKKAMEAQTARRKPRSRTKVESRPE